MFDPEPIITAGTGMTSELTIELRKPTEAETHQPECAADDSSWGRLSQNEEEAPIILPDIKKLWTDNSATNQIKIQKQKDIVFDSIYKKYFKSPEDWKIK